MLILLTEIISLLIIPIIELVVGILKPKKEINGLIGYRTAKTRSSQEMWDYAQLLMKKYMLKAGIISAIIGIIGVVIMFLVSQNTGAMIMTVIVLVQVAILIGVVILLQKEMNKKN